MAESDFVMAVDPGGKKRRVPAHYLGNDALKFKLPPSARKSKVQEPAQADIERVEEPAAQTAKTTVKEPAAAGEK